MAEIGLIASVVGVAGAALTSSRALFEMVDEVRNAPVELSAISRDIHSFHDVVSSVQMAIRDRLVIKALLGDKKLCELVIRLEAPLQNCSTILTQLKPRIQTHLKSTSDGKLRISSIDVRWIFKKKDIIDCRNRLEVTKSTLDAALTSVIFFCSLRSAGQDIDSVLSSDVSTIGRDLDAGSVLREYAESIAPRSPPLDAVSMMDRIELPTRLNNQSTELDADGAGIIDWTELPAELSDKSTEPDAAAVGTSSSSSHSTTHRSASGTSSSNPEATEKINDVLNPNETGEPINSTSERSLMPYSIAKRFFTAIEANDPETIKALLREGFDVNHVAEDGETALHKTIKEGREDIVRILLANHANVNTENAKSYPRNMTPLHYAAWYNYKSIVEVLLDNGADTAARDGRGHTALGASIYRGHDDIAIALIQYESNLCDKTDLVNTPLELAIMLDRPMIVEALIARGKHVGQLQAMLDAVNEKGRTPLMLAIRMGSIEIVSQLLAVGANIEECDSHGYTPLLEAAYNGNTKMIDFLITQGADRQARNNEGENYLQVLEKRHRQEYKVYIKKANS